MVPGGGTVLRCAARALELGIAPAAHCELRLLRADAFETLGRLEDQGQELDIAQRSAQTELERARAAIDRAVLQWRMGRADEALALAREGVEAARQAGDAETLALALGRFGLIRTYGGAIDEGAVAIAEAAPIARSQGPLMAAMAATWQAQVANARGDYGEKMRAHREAQRLYQEIGDLRRATGAELNLADAANRVGAYDQAASALADTSEKADRVGNTLWKGYAQLNLAYAHSMLGRNEMARAALAQAQAIAERTGEARLAVFADIYGARIDLADAPERAAARADAAAKEARARSLPSLEILASAVAASAHLACGHGEEADRASAHALSIRDELGGVEEDEADVFLVRARVLEALGRHAESHEMRQKGRARVRELAEKIADLELRARFLSDVPAHRDLIDG
jgi:tetratricopeptide (TPR) repeat protein